MIALDHLLYAVRDLDGAADRFSREHGLGSYEGGHHPAFGTSNRIVPLGDAYIELIGVTDEATGRNNPLGAHILRWVEHGDRWLGWVARTDDIDAIAAEHGLIVLPGERSRPDGTTVSWRAAGMERLLDDPSVPFFIQWDDGAPHPSDHPAAGQGTIAEVRIAPSPATDAIAVPGVSFEDDGARPGVRTAEVRLENGSIISIA